MKKFYAVCLTSLSLCPVFGLDFSTRMGFSRFVTGGVESTILPLELSIGHNLGNWKIGLDYGLAYGRLDTYYRDRRQAIRSGSAVGAVSWQRGFGGVEISLGLKLGIAPLTLMRGSLDDKVLTQYTYRSAGSATGWLNPWLWLTNNYPVLTTIGIEKKFGFLRMHISADMGYLISLNSQPDRLGIHIHNRWQYERWDLRPYTGFGLFQLSQSLENNDTNQWVGFLGTEYLYSQTAVGFQVNVNLDGPYGLAGEGSRHVWGIILTFSQHW